MIDGSIFIQSVSITKKPLGIIQPISSVGSVLDILVISSKESALGEPLLVNAT
jgi:hypothetical protein